MLIFDEGPLDERRASQRYKSDYYGKCLQTSETKVGSPLWALGGQPHTRKLLDHAQNGDLAL